MGSVSGRSHNAQNHRVAAGDVDFIFRVDGNSACILLLFCEGVMRRGIIKGARAIWTPTTKSGGPYEVEITGNDHGRVYCLLDGKEHGDYECAFELIKEGDSNSRVAK